MIQKDLPHLSQTLGRQRIRLFPLQSPIEPFHPLVQGDGVQRHISIEKMASIFQNMMDGQVDQAHIMGLLGQDQFFSQVVDGGIGMVVVPIRKGLVPKQGIFPQRYLPPLILLPESALLHALEKGRIDRRDRLGENIAQQRQTLFPAFQPPSGDAEAAPLFRLLRFGKLPDTPERLAVFPEDPVLFVRYRPADGFRADVKPREICHLFPSPVLTEQLFCVKMGM